MRQPTVRENEEFARREGFYEGGAYEGVRCFQRLLAEYSNAAMYLHRNSRLTPKEVHMCMVMKVRMEKYIGWLGTFGISPAMTYTCPIEYIHRLEKLLLHSNPVSFKKHKHDVFAYDLEEHSGRFNVEQEYKPRVVVVRKDERVFKNWRQF